MTSVERANFRERARAFCDAATEHGQGVSVTHPLYQTIVESRDKGPYYSSCGDLGHALVEYLLDGTGKRPAWLNRGAQYRVGMNVSRLALKGIGINPLARQPREGEQLQTGDICVMWSRPDTTDAHVFVVDTHGPESISSWDYGQGAMKPDAWARDPKQIEGAHRTRVIAGYAMVSGVRLPALACANGVRKVIHSVLSLDDLYDYAHA